MRNQLQSVDVDGGPRRPTHVRAEVLEVTRPERSGASAFVRLRVVRAYLGSVAPGSELAVRLDVATDGAPDFAPGASAHPWAKLRAARYLELCLDEAGQFPEGGLCTVVSGPNGAPALSPAERAICPRCAVPGERQQDARAPWRGPLFHVGYGLVFAALLLACGALVAPSLGGGRASWLWGAGGTLAVGLAAWRASGRTGQLGPVRCPRCGELVPGPRR